MSQFNVYESLFKRVEGRWIFRAPNPRIFGDTPHYVVTDEQKAQLIELLKLSPPRQILLALLIVIGSVTWIFAVLGMAGSLGLNVETASLFELVVMVILCVAPFLAIVPALAAVQLRQLKPALRELPKTDQRITGREMREVRVNSMSLKLLLFLGGLWAWLALMHGTALAIRTARHPLFSDPLSIIYFSCIVLALVVTAIFFRLALRKIRRKTGHT
jgi:hypothetical protein